MKIALPVVFGLLGGACLSWLCLVLLAPNLSIDMALGIIAIGGVLGGVAAVIFTLRRARIGRKNG